MATDAQLRAKEKYRKKSVRSVLLSFYPKEHQLYEKLKERGESEGGVSGYIKRLIAEDLNIKINGE